MVADAAENGLDLRQARGPVLATMWEFPPMRGCGSRIE